jgi:purine catabolism regulator
VSIGGYYAEAEGLMQSYREAKSVLEVSKKLGISPGVLWYDDMALYSLLDKMATQAEMKNWVWRSIGPLLSYDSKRKTELAKTLEAFLDCGQSIQKAAFLLNIHPKTLKYRIDGIKGLLSIENFLGDEHLILHIACKCRKLIEFSQNG